MGQPIDLSVITSYYNRPDALERFKKVSKEVEKYFPNVEFIIDEWNQNSIFSTAICHNRAARKAKGTWLLKQDIDCIALNMDIYFKIINHMKDKPYTYFMNIGCKNYLSDLGFPQGNQYVCSKQAFFQVGGEPEWEGYGCEDYAILYKLKILKDPDWKVPYNDFNIQTVIRDKLTRVLNQKFQDYYFFHCPHKQDNFEYMAQSHINRKKLFHLCKEIDYDRYHYCNLQTTGDGKKSD